MANSAGVNGKRTGPALPSYGKVARVPFRDQGSFAMERPAPGRTGDERESLVAASVRGSNVRRGSRIAPGVGHSTKLCLAERLASFTHGDFLKSPLFQWEVRKFESRTKYHFLMTTRASLLIRSTIERTPLERCGVKCADKQRLSNRPWAKNDRIRDAVLPEKSASRSATSPRTI